MARITDRNVQALVPTTQETEPFITLASHMVDRYAVAVPTAYDILLADLELYLACHILTLSIRRVDQQRLGETSVTYARENLGQGLKSTVWGQMALTLDASGVLASQGFRRATITIL